MIILQINIAICDDNIAFIHQIEKMIKNFSHDNKNSFQLFPFISGDRLLKKIENDFTPDIIFLDIDLNEKNLGTNLGKEIKKYRPDILLIYISGYTCYYKELVVSEPFSFIEKPLDSKQVEYVLRTAIDRLYYLKEKFIFTYKSYGTIFKVDLKDVLYFESQHRIINIHMNTGEIAHFYEKLDNVENEIENIFPYFLRINKSYYVNYYFIEKHSNSFITIRGENIKISSKYKKSYLDKMYILL